MRLSLVLFLPLPRSHPDVTKDNAEVKSVLDGLVGRKTDRLMSSPRLRDVSAEHFRESKEMQAQMFKAIKCVD